MNMSKFKQKVEQATKIIPSGKVVSYGQLALMIGAPGAAQAVGNSLHDLDNQTPWWRVVNNAGRISTQCTTHTAKTQKKKLEAEGVTIDKRLTFDIEKYRFRPTPKELKNLELDESYVEEVIRKYLID